MGRHKFGETDREKALLEMIVYHRKLGKTYRWIAEHFNQMQEMPRFASKWTGALVWYIYINRCKP